MNLSALFVASALDIPLEWVIGLGLALFAANVGMWPMIEGMVERIEKEFGTKMTVVATGGLAELLLHRLPTLPGAPA